MTNKQILKIIICDDHKIFRNGVKSLLEHENIGTVIAEADNGNEFLDIIDKHKPDVVLMDIDMPVLDGIETTKRAIKRHPDLKILTLSMFGDERHYREMINAGAKGFILKSSDIQELELAIKTIARGESYFSNELLRRIIVKMGNADINADSVKELKINLKEREMQVLKNVCSGLSTNEIADKISLSPKTVEFYRTQLLSKTKTKNAVSLVIFAIKHKLIEI